MKKEQIIAIIFGSILGVVVAAWVWKLSKQKPQEPKKININQFEIAQDNPETDFDFKLTYPLKNSVFPNKQATITGFTPSNSLVAVHTNQVYLAKPNEKNEFSIKVELTPGINNVTVWSIKPGEKSKVENLTLIYSSKVGLNEEDGNKAIISVIGTITDISSESIQLRSENGEIEQLSVAKDATYALINSESKDLEFKDLAIGDFVAAIGTRNNEGVFNVNRVLVTTISQTNKMNLLTGVIKNLSKKEFIISSAENNEVSIDATGSINIYSFDLSAEKLSSAKEGDEIIVFGKFKDKELVAETIVLL